MSNAQYTADNFLIVKGSQVEYHGKQYVVEQFGDEVERPGQVRIVDPSAKPTDRHDGTWTTPDNLYGQAFAPEGRGVDDPDGEQQIKAEQEPSEVKGTVLLGGGFSVEAAKEPEREAEVITSKDVGALEDVLDPNDGGDTDDSPSPQQ